MAGAVLRDCATPITEARGRTRGDPSELERSSFQSFAQYGGGETLSSTEPLAPESGCADPEGGSNGGPGIRVELEEVAPLEGDHNESTTLKTPRSIP